MRFVVKEQQVLASTAKIQSHISYLRASQGLLERVLGGGLTREQQFFLIAPGTSHIHWLVNHITWSLDETVLKSLTGESMLDDTWAERYGTGSKAAPNDGSEKSLEEIQNQLRTCFEAAIKALGAREDDFLDEPLPAESRASNMFKTRADLTGEALPGVGERSWDASSVRREPAGHF